jgi:hypothetical protein
MMDRFKALTDAVNKAFPSAKQANDNLKIALNRVKKMNKQELIDKAVEQLKGVLPSHAHGSHYLYTDGKKYTLGIISDSDRDIPDINKWSLICDQPEFQQRARELGWINGYKWGVEYQTNGKKPDLPDDLIVDIQFNGSTTWRGGSVSLFVWSSVERFKIIDNHYKPVEQSQPADTDEVACVAKNNNKWYDYEQQKAIALPPVGVECEVAEPIHNSGDRVKILFHDDGNAIARYLSGDELGSLAEFLPIELRPLDHATRKDNIERKRVVDAAVKSIGYDQLSETSVLYECINRMYDKGFLKLP